MKKNPAKKAPPTAAEKILAAQRALEDSIHRSCKRFEAATGMTVVAVLHPKGESDYGRYATSIDGRVNVVIDAPRPKPIKKVLVP